MLALAVVTYQMDLFPDSASNSKLDGCCNADYDGDFETAGGDIGVTLDCEQATSSSKVSVVRRRA